MISTHTCARATHTHRRMPYVYALHVCLTCMPYVYALRVCLMCMPYVYASQRRRGCQTKSGACMNSRAMIKQRSVFVCLCLCVCLRLCVCLCACLCLCPRRSFSPSPLCLCLCCCLCLSALNPKAFASSLSVRRLTKLIKLTKLQLTN
jgi:hypothetical protein